MDIYFIFGVFGLGLYFVGQSDHKGRSLWAVGLVFLFANSSLFFYRTNSFSSRWEKFLTRVFFCLRGIQIVFGFTEYWVHLDA